jgi:hypothetical protein
MTLMHDIYAQDDRKKAPRTNVVAGLELQAQALLPSLKVQRAVI